VDSQQFDAGREGARRLHRVISLYCSLFCWKNRVDAVLLPKNELYHILGVSRIKEARREWLKEDIKDYFEFYFTHEIGDKEYFVFSRECLEDLRTTKSYKLLSGDLNVISKLDDAALFGTEAEIKALEIVKEKLPFLQGTTSSTSHLLGLKMSSLASGVISINDMFQD